MKNKTVEEAWAHFSRNNFIDALKGFLDAEDLYGYGLFYANISACLRRIKKDEKNFVLAKAVQENEKELRLLRRSYFFDSEWYRNKYPEVQFLGMDPALHYYRYGLFLANDPGPNFCGRFYIDTHPGCIKNKINPLLHHIKRKGLNAEIIPTMQYVLWAAYRSVSSIGHEKAIELAKRYLPTELSYTTAILCANWAHLRGDRASWLKSVNAYLSNFDLSPIMLREGNSLLEQLSTKVLTPVNCGPLISVIMPAWNAEKTIRAAARSILNQTWKNIELLIVDDASEDGTWIALKEIAAADSRVKIFRNKANVGPYVSKNIALKESRGEWVTGHDADDWAHPQRLEKHVAVALSEDLKASLTYMIRMQPDGMFGHVGKVTAFSFDGVARKASIACLFRGDFLRDRLGYWDSVRFGADSEMIERANGLLAGNLKNIRQIGMICLDLETSLTNHPKHGVHKTEGISPIRAQYRESWSNWQKNVMTAENAFLSFPQENRRYSASPEMVVEKEFIQRNMLAVH